jgi:hypothetical protein
MATRKTKGNKVTRAVVARRAARKKARSFRKAVRKAVERTHDPTLRTKSGTPQRRRAAKLMQIRYVRTTTGRVRFIPLLGTVGSKQSYASRQGARRAARKLYKGYRVIAVVAA